MKNIKDNSCINGKTLAILAESLYLMNLMLIPVLGFLILTVLYFKYEKCSQLAGSHLRQTFSASIWAGMLLILVNVVILMAGGYQAPYTGVIVVLYFTICHSTLIFLGMYGLVKAMAGEKFHYPIIGTTS